LIPGFTVGQVSTLTLSSSLRQCSGSKHSPRKISFPMTRVGLCIFTYYFYCDWCNTDSGQLVLEPPMILSLTNSGGGPTPIPTPSLAHRRKQTDNWPELGVLVLSGPSVKRSIQSSLNYFLGSSYLAWLQTFLLPE
jgi:hypothetical protein